MTSKESHRQLNRVATSGTIGGVMVSILAQNTTDVGLIPALGTIFPIFITPLSMKLVVMISILNKLQTVWLLNLLSA